MAEWLPMVAVASLTVGVALGFATCLWMGNRGYIELSFKWKGIEIGCKLRREQVETHQPGRVKDIDDKSPEGTDKKKRGQAA